MQKKQALDTCILFAEYFQTKHHAPMSSGMPPEGFMLLHTCFDYRLADDENLRIQGRKNIFHPRNAAAFVPEYDSGNTASPLPADFSAAFEFGMNVKNIVIMGHTDCGANKLLYNALINDSAELDPAAKYMLHVAPTELKERLKEAHDAKANPLELQAISERALVLESIQNLYDYVLKNKTARQRLDSGEIHIIAAIRDVSNNRILVFDPDHHKFRSLEEIRIDAGSPHPSELLSFATGAGKPKNGHIIKAGAASESIATLHERDVKLGIANEYAAITQLKDAAKAGL